MFEVGDIVVIQEINSEPGSPAYNLAGSKVRITTKIKLANSSAIYNLEMIEIKAKDPELYSPYCLLLNWTDPYLCYAENIVADDDVINILLEG